MKLYLSTLGLLLVSGILSAQEPKGYSALHFFFDNTEFAHSQLTTDQTMAGIGLTQQIGWQWEGKHRIMGGVYAQKKLGNTRFINTVQLLAYYQLKATNTLFKVGAFERDALLNDYSNLLFQDSVTYYKHTMEGMFLQKGDERQFIKLWLDWTGLQSATERESFFIGTSAYQRFGKLLFVDFQSYLFHYATTRPNIHGQSVCDNLLGELSIGLTHSNAHGLNNLRLSVGMLAGFERDRRKMDDYRTPLGLTLRANVQYKHFGTENTFYYGQKQMTLYPQYGNRLYWGNPFLRSGSYFQNKLYWNFLDTKYVKGQLAARTHFAEQKVFFEQMLTLRANLHFKEEQ